MELIISTDKERVDLEKVIRFLKDESYWARSRSIEQIEKSIEHSFCFGLYEGKEMIAFARVITDFAVFAYLADVFVDKNYRSKGYGKRLMNEIMNHPDLQMISRWMLGTLDAHELYRPFGFNEVKEAHRWMEYMPKGTEIKR